METTIHCPNKACVHHKNHEEDNIFYYQNGFYKVKNGNKVRRLVCKFCGKKFSINTFKDTYRQKKPHLNTEVFKLISSSVTLRRSAIILKCNRKTVIRKMIFLSEKIRKQHSEFLESFFTKEVQFDEMETYAHSKAKPLSVALAVCGTSGKIIDVQGCKMTTKGRLADIGRDKYHWTEDNRQVCAASVLATVSTVTSEKVKITCDKKRSYPNLVHAQMPHAEIHQVLSRGRKIKSETIDALVKGLEDYEEKPAYNLVEEGQKIRSFDEMFTLNHTCAKVRADMSRMRRKTWASTKKLEFLNHHLMIYVGWNNGYEG